MYQMPPQWQCMISDLLTQVNQFRERVFFQKTQNKLFQIS